MIKITTWNVNGLRAALRKEADRWWNQHEPDVLCLQEIRARPDQLSKKQRADLAWPHAEWHPAERPGYSGVATFSRSEPVASGTGLGDPCFDREGRLIETRFPDFTLFNGYFPNGRHDLSRVDFKLAFYDQLLQACDKIHARGEAVIVCGDFNTAHAEIDLANPKENAGSTGFLPREREWIDRYLSHGFVDVYRFLYPQEVAYTWWTYRFNARARNIGWRLDYFLVSESLVPKIRDVVIHAEVMGSDHCPVTLELEVSGR